MFKVNQNNLLLYSNAAGSHDSKEYAIRIVLKPWNKLDIRGRSGVRQLVSSL